MLINKQCKMSIVRSSKDYINRIAHYIPYRTRCLQNVKALLFTERTDDQKCPDNPFSSHHTAQNSEHNIRVQMKLMDDKSLFSMQTSNIRLVNPFTSKKATPEQTHDLLQFRSIGEKEFLLRVITFILNQPSVNTPNRKRRLSEKNLTNSEFHSSKVTKSLYCLL